MSSRLLGPPPSARDYISVAQYVQEHLEGIRSVEDTISQSLEALSVRDKDSHSITSIFQDFAMGLARKLDQELAHRSGHEIFGRQLLGVPVLLKENISVNGAPTQCGSRILEGYRSPYNATAVERLLNAGAIPIGYTNMDEFAMGSSCEYSVHGPTRNPYDRHRVPGGSSGGGAAASALGLAPISLGSDTGGSVRQPAAYCNVYGFKPTYGRVSRFGLVAFGSSLDQISPFARSARDLERVMSVISGPDSKDATSLRKKSDWVEISQTKDNLEGFKFGVPRQLLNSILEDNIRRAFESFLEEVEKLGACILELDMPEIRVALPAYYLISAAEASSNLARFDGLKYGLRLAADSREALVRESRTNGFGAEVKRRICLGTFVLSAGYYDRYYGRACDARKIIGAAFQRAHESCDAILMPTAPSVAFEIGARSSDPVQMYANDVLTVPPSLLGLPALSVPMATDSRLPMGVQIIGRHLEDEFVISIGVLLEKMQLCGIEGLGECNGVAQ